jgi:phage baseplate assembly protein W
MSVPINLANSLIEQAALGIGLQAPLTTNPQTGDFVRLSVADNVRSCILDLLSTRVGERVMNEDFGTLIPLAIFENSEGLIDVLPFRVKEAITQYETRVTRVTCTVDIIDPTTTRLNVGWVLKATGKRDSLVYPYYTEPSAGGVTADV